MENHIISTLEDLEESARADVDIVEQLITGTKDFQCQASLRTLQDLFRGNIGAVRGVIEELRNRQS